MITFLDCSGNIPALNLQYLPFDVTLEQFDALSNNERRVMVSAFSTECVPQVRFLIIISEVCTFHASESAAYGLLSSPCYTVYYTFLGGIEPMTARTED